jgi:hypothetical protein
MGILTGTRHGDEANALLHFYQRQAKRLEASRSYFMAAVALGAALETALLTYMLVEWGEDNGGELEIPDDVRLSDLLEAAKEFDLLDAVQFRQSRKTPALSLVKVIHEIQAMRNNLHPARALRKSFNPASFKVKEYRRLRDIYSTVIENLLHHL